MTTSYTAKLQAMGASFKKMGQDIPGVMRAAYALGQEGFKDGALDAKTKELMALALAIGARCDGCIAQHAMTLVKLGATAQEVNETLGVAMAMGGGPSMTYATHALTAFEEFQAAAENA